MAVSICFVDRSPSEYVQTGLINLCSMLAESEINASCCRKAEEAPPGSIVILHDPVDEESIPDACKVLGQRTLNRRERLVLAEKCGLPVPRWSSLDSQNDIVNLMDAWQVNHLLYKADSSFARRGIRLMTRHESAPLNKFIPAVDIFMRVIDGDHHTLKVDMFFDQVIGCRDLLTRSVFDKRFRACFYGPSRLGQTPQLDKGLEILGNAVMKYGVALSSIDIMIDNSGNPWVIELNTCSVGREETWRRWPEIFVNGYAKAVTRWVDAGCKADYYNGIPASVSMLADREGGCAFP